MLNEKITKIAHRKNAKIWIAAIIFFALVWLYPVHMKNIVLWMDTSEDTQAHVVAQLSWNAGDGFLEENISENAIVAQEVFVRIPWNAKKNADQYRLALLNEDKDISIYSIKLNGDEIPADSFLDYVESTENLELEQQGDRIVAHVNGSDPVMTFNADFTKLVRKKWHMANKTRLWLSLAGVIATMWGIIYVKMEDKE
ncbi:MAG: hypothetical protein MR016_10770 [Agathobacter sp.]|nr:hypothetical protein [Agathobacter sp.]